MRMKDGYLGIVLEQRHKLFEMELFADLCTLDLSMRARWYKGQNVPCHRAYPAHCPARSAS